MVAKSSIARKLRGEQLDKLIGRSCNKVPDSDDEQGSKRTSKSMRSKGKKKEPKNIPTWVAWLLVFVVFGSTFVQIVTNIWTQPSMSDTH